MVQPIVMPKPGQMTETCTVVKWHKKEGDAVAKGDILFEIETDKAAMEVESFFAGTLLKIAAGEGQTVPVQTVIGFIGNPGEPIPAIAPPAAAVGGTSGPDSAAVRGAEPAVPTATTARSGPEVPPTSPLAVSATLAPPATSAAPKLSPRAARLARESLCFDVARVAGTGPGGRVVERDVKAHLEARGYGRVLLTPAAREMTAREKIDLLALEGTGDGGRVRVEDVERAVAERPRPMSRMRQVIAERLARSVVTAPHFYVSVSVDMTDLLAWRAEIKKAGAPFTVTDFVNQAVVETLKEFPAVNSATDGRSVRWHSRVHLGVAVNLEQGLVVPVVRDAGALGVRELHDRLADLAARAREGKLAPDEMSGSTFTVSNLGMMSVESFTAIINPGESAILAVSSAIPKPVVKDGQVVVRQMMNITLSSDHRLVDGALAARFVNALKTRIEDVERWKRTAAW